MKSFSKIRFNDPIKVQHIRAGKVIGEYLLHNDVVDVGINSLLDINFRNQTQIANWYLGLVDNAAFSAFADADTMSSHTGWAENTDYDEVTRPEWVTAAAATRAISNSTTVDFTMNSTAAIKGIFITSNNTISGTTGTLWATAAFASVVNVVSADVFKITYTVSA